MQENLNELHKDDATLPIKVSKGWGHELHIVNCEEYCLKKLVFNKKGAKFSMHFHKDKKETWYIEKGKFQLDFIKTEDATRHTVILGEGVNWTNRTLLPHQLTCLTENGEITEVSTTDSVEDNYRIEQGDSQNVLEQN